jgi:hypothetical protein
MAKKGLYAVPPRGNKPNTTSKKTRGVASSQETLKRSKSLVAHNMGILKLPRITTVDVYSKERSFFWNLLLKDVKMEMVAYSA